MATCPACGHALTAAKRKTPYRAIVFTTIDTRAGTRKKTRTVTSGAAYVLWNSECTCEPWRLEGSGSFLWNGLHAVRRAAMAVFADDPNVHQISIRTNQDREVYRFYRQLRLEECLLFSDAKGAV